MTKLKRLISGLMLVCLLMSTCLITKADNKITQTEVSKYALSFDGAKDIPYVFGGGRGYGSMEELKSAGVGTDCSGFVGYVYKHFGMDIPMQSGAILSSAVKQISEEEAVPGDVCYWENHVAIYIGEGKIVHTNSAKGLTPYPHVSDYSNGSYNYPEKFLRMVDDVSKLKPLDGAVADETNEQVINTEGVGSVINESDLTGMPTESSLRFAQEQLELKSRADLSVAEIAQLDYIKTSIKEYYPNPVKWYNVATSFIGIVLLLYGVLLLMAYVFDYTNTFIDISLMSILSFGKFRILEKYEKGITEVGWNERQRVTYMTVPMLIVRVTVVIGIGLLLVSGKINELMILLIEKIT